MSYYSQTELEQMAFAEVGNGVYISRKASVYGADKISIGNNVRIDDFCILSASVGRLTIGSNIHIACYSAIIGAGVITLNDYCNISSRVSIYSSSDDYSGEYMTNPLIPKAFTNVNDSPVDIGKHVIIGCGTVILPGVTIGDGCAVGALSFVNRSLNSWGVYAGQPAKYVKARSKKLLLLEDKLEQVMLLEKKQSKTC